MSSLRSANELLNAALAPYRDDLVIATKVGPRRDIYGWWLPYSTPGQLRGEVEENLRQLGRNHLNLVNLRLSGLGSVADHFSAGAVARRRVDPPFRAPATSALSATTSLPQRRVLRLTTAHGSRQSTRPAVDPAAKAPAGSLDTGNAVELVELLQFVQAWFATNPDQPWRVAKPFPGKPGLSPR